MIKIYADLPARRNRQIIADGLMLGWSVVWVLIARIVHGATLTLTAPGRALESAGGSFRDRMQGAGDRVDGLPLVQDRIAVPLREVSGVGSDIAAAGADLVSAAERVALVAALMTALLPIAIVGAIWLALRLRWARRAAEAAHLIDVRADLDLFALRALAQQRLPALARISDDPAGAWRRGDVAVIRALAELELSGIGLRLPDRPTS